MSDISLRDFINLGKPFLKDYLLEQGVKIVKKGQTEFFSCIHPDHPDKNPSCALYHDLNNEIAVCFACNFKLDIYTAANILENKPLYGLEFIKDNVEYILNKYNVSYEPVTITEEQLTRFKYEHVYDEATKMLASTIDRTNGKLIYSDLSHAAKRGWREPICRTLGIGTIVDFDRFIADLAKITSIPESNLINMGITPSLFGPDYITFSIRDHNGRPRGFVARYLKWEKGSEKSKYTNTSLEDNPYYRKDHILYGLDIAKKCKDLRLDIFEGYGSFVTAQQAGHKNCVSIGGTALTEHHVDLIRDLGFRHINLVLDVDNTGKDKMDRYITKFSGYNGLEVTIMHLPIKEDDLKDYGKNDPDFFISAYGLAEYRNIKPVDAFEHMLSKQEAFNEKEPLALEFCHRMIPLVINQPDHIRRGKMISALSEHTKIDKEDIKLEIARLEKSDIKNIKEELSKKMRNISDPDDMQNLLSSTLHNLGETTSNKKDKYLISIAESIEVYDDVFKEMNTSPEGIHGWLTGYTPLDEILDGIPKPGKSGGRAIGLASAPQHGKALADSTPMVCNRDGIDILTTHGELRIGDYVYSDKGTKVKVLAVGPAINDCDRKLVLFNDVEIVCHANHEWVIYNDTRRGNMARMKSIVDTKWLENENLLYKTKGGRLRPRFLVDGVHTKNRRGIKAIEKIDPVVGRCIQVEGGIYLAGKAFVPTHNSAILLNLALNVSMMNQDATILYWAIDDHRKAILYRLVSILSDVPMKKVLNTERRTAEEQKAILDAQEILRTLTMERKLVFKDDKFGRSKSKAEAWIKETQDNTGNQILFCVDSLHNIKGGDSQDTRVKVLTSSMWLKSLVASVPCTALSTIELVKNRKEEKPNLMSVAETAKIEFDFDTIGIVWNESQGLYTNVANVGSKWGSPGNWKPIIELDLQKNKSGTGEKGSVYFRLDTDTTKLVASSRNIKSLMSKFSNSMEATGDSGIRYTSVSTRDEEIKDSEEDNDKDDTVTGWEGQTDE